MKGSLVVEIAYFTYCTLSAALEIFQIYSDDTKDQEAGGITRILSAIWELFVLSQTIWDLLSTTQLYVTQGHEGSCINTS